MSKQGDLQEYILGIAEDNLKFYSNKTIVDLYNDFITADDLAEVLKEKYWDDMKDAECDRILEDHRGA